MNRHETVNCHDTVQATGAKNSFMSHVEASNWKKASAERAKCNLHFNPLVRE